MERQRTLSPRLSSLRQAVARHSPQLPPAVLDELFTQLDPDYFALFPPAQIATHAALLAAVSEAEPVHVRITPRGATRAEVLVVGYDFFGEFSLITGLMAAYGLNIVEGQVFSYRRGPVRPTPWGTSRGGKIVDLFTVEFSPQRPFDAAAQAAFAAQLRELVALLRQGELQQARERLNYQLVDAVRTASQAFAARLYPVDIRIDNAASADWTVVHISAEDTPGFLYSLSNALAMRGIYIHRVRIGSAAGKVQDCLYLGRRQGGKITKITSEEGQWELRFIVALIKQFTHFLTVAPDPVKALRHFDQLLDRLAHSEAGRAAVDWLGKAEALKALATLLGSSDFLWEDFLRMQHANLLPLLRDQQQTARRVPKAELAQRLQQELAAAPEAAKAVLNAFKDREMFRIDMRHLLHPELPFGAFSEELTELAEVVLAAALELAHAALQARYGAPQLADGRPCPFALFGLGKFGGRELGYASDIELLCVYGGAGTTSGPQRLTTTEYAELLVQQLRELIVARRAGIFALDLRLRPFGTQGPLATSLEAFRDYYRHGGAAAPFERQALIKLRWVAGDAALGREVEALRDAFVYSPEPFDLEMARHLRQRQREELVRPGSVDAKYSRGGLLDVEYAVQYLQLLHGASTPAVRTPNTLEALDALHAAAHLSTEEYQALREAYVFLRHLIDALRIVRGNARDLVLPATESEEFTFLARRMGYWDDQEATARLARDIAHHMHEAARIYQERFGATAAPS